MLRSRLDGTDSSPLLLRTTITQNGAHLRSESIEIEDVQKLAGQVADVGLTPRGTAA